MLRKHTTSAALAIAAALVSAAPLQAQGPGRQGPATTVIHGGTVHVGDGTVLENATVVVRGSKVAAVMEKGAGKGMSAGLAHGQPSNPEGGAPKAGPPGVTMIDATGMHVYPGLVDSDSLLLVSPGMYSSGAGKPSHDVRDAVDLFAAHDREDAVSQGVTSVYVGPRGGGFFDGSGAVFKLAPASSMADILVSADAAMSGRLGAPEAFSSQRLRDLKGLTAKLEATEKYVESWEEYAEKLEEYEEALIELRKDAGKSGKGAAPKKGSKKDADKKDEKDGSKKEEGDKKEGEEGDEPPKDDEGKRALDAAIQEAIEQSYAAIAQERRRNSRRPPQGGGNGGDASKKGEKEGDKKDDDKKPKKPKKPSFNADQEELKRLLAGEFPLRIRVYRAADILNVLELQRRFHFDLVLIGMSETAQVAEEIEAAGISVVLTQSLSAGHLNKGRFDLMALETGAKLHEAGVRFALSTTRGAANEARFLALGAAAAVAGGLDAEDALRATTLDAAAILGVSDRIGSIEKGKDADLVISSGPPLSSSARIQQVLINGKVVYRR